MTLQHKYIAGLVLEGTRKISLPAIAQTARDLICQIPEIANNPALQSTTAAEQLLAIMQPAIAQWISEQCPDVPDRYREDRQSSIVRLAEERGVESERNHATIEGQASAAVRKRSGMEAFDDELLNLSPLPDLWPSSSPTATATQRTNAPQSDNGLDDDSGDDDGLYGDASPGGLRDDCSESSFGNKEQVVVAAEQYS
ncbi:unnamed protein product [Alternaria alternata]